MLILRKLLWLFAVFFLFLFNTAYSLPPLQLYVELTPAGGTLKLPPGRYAGPAIIKRQITIDGGGKVVIDGGGSGSVITIKADKSIIHGLDITHSGGSHDSVDAGILIKANNTISDNITGIVVIYSNEMDIHHNRFLI